MSTLAVCASAQQKHEPVVMLIECDGLEPIAMLGSICVPVFSSKLVN